MAIFTAKSSTERRAQLNVNQYLLSQQVKIPGDQLRAQKYISNGTDGQEGPKWHLKFHRCTGLYHNEHADDRSDG
jgi:hypothetical protein